MKISTQFFKIFFFLFISVMGYGQEEKLILAKIESESVEKQLSIKAMVINQSETYQELNYLLIAIKKGKTGNLSNNRQSGKFTVNPSESKQLSQMNIGMDEGDALKAFLYIKDEESGNLIAKDSLEINQDFFNKKAENVEKETAFELKGLTIDETKTKVGKDFYDLFYIQYNQLPEKSSSAIKILEMPTRGTSSQMNIEMDDKVIYSFVINPSEEFLKEQLGNTLYYIREYNARKKLIKNEFMY